MTGIYQLSDRIDRLVRDEQITHSFIHDALRKYSLGLLDMKFENYIRNNFSNVILGVIRLGEISIGAGLSRANKPRGDEIQKIATKNRTSDQKEKDMICLIWDAAKDEVAQLELSRVCEIITILKTKDMKSAVTYLCIVEDTIQ